VGGSSWVVVELKEVREKEEVMVVEAGVAGAQCDDAE
jgi:hypothetical protein